MRCLCYAKFLSKGTIPRDEFCTHIGSIWSCIEDIPRTTNNAVNLNQCEIRRSSTSILFIADCKSIEQLTYDLETMPGAGISNVEVFPVQEKVEV